MATRRKPPRPERTVSRHPKLAGQVFSLYAYLERIEAAIESDNTSPEELAHITRSLAAIEAARYDLDMTLEARQWMLLRALDGASERFAKIGERGGDGRKIDRAWVRRRWADDVISSVAYLDPELGSALTQHIEDLESVIEAWVRVASVGARKGITKWPDTAALFSKVGLGTAGDQALRQVYEKRKRANTRTK